MEKQSLSDELKQLVQARHGEKNKIGRQKFDESIESFIPKLKESASYGRSCWSWDSHKWPDRSLGFVERAREWANENGLVASIEPGMCGEDDLPYQVLVFRW